MLMSGLKINLETVFNYTAILGKSQPPSVSRQISLGNKGMSTATSTLGVRIMEAKPASHKVFCVVNRQSIRREDYGSETRLP